MDHNIKDVIFSFAGVFLEKPLDVTGLSADPAMTPPLSGATKTGDWGTVTMLMAIETSTMTCPPNP